MKVLKFKNSDDALVIADEVEELTPQPKKIQIVTREDGRKDVYQVDEYGKKYLRLGGCAAELETVDATGTFKEGKRYEVKAGKLVEKAEEVAE